MFKQNLLKYLWKIEKPQDCALTAENRSAIINQRSPISERAFRCNRNQAFFREHARIELTVFLQQWKLKTVTTVTAIYGPLLGKHCTDVAVYRDIKTLAKREQMTGEGCGR